MPKLLMLPASPSCPGWPCSPWLRVVLAHGGKTPICGVDFTRGICGVSIIRSGEAMETALRECCQGIKLGKILVHRSVLGTAVPGAVCRQQVPAIP